MRLIIVHDKSLRAMVVARALQCIMSCWGSMVSRIDKRILEMIQQTTYRSVSQIPLTSYSEDFKVEVLEASNKQGSMKLNEIIASVRDARDARLILLNPENYYVTSYGILQGKLASAIPKLGYSENKFRRQYESEVDGKDSDSFSLNAKLSCIQNLKLHYMNSLWGVQTMNSIMKMQCKISREAFMRNCRLSELDMSEYGQIIQELQDISSSLAEFFLPVLTTLDKNSFSTTICMIYNSVLGRKALGNTFSGYFDTDFYNQFLLKCGVLYYGVGRHYASEYFKLRFQDMQEKLCSKGSGVMGANQELRDCLAAMAQTYWDEDTLKKLNKSLVGIIKDMWKSLDIAQYSFGQDTTGQGDSLYLVIWVKTNTVAEWVAEYILMGCSMVYEVPVILHLVNLGDDGKCKAFSCRLALDSMQAFVSEKNQEVDKRYESVYVAGEGLAERNPWAGTPINIFSNASITRRWYTGNPKYLIQEGVLI